MGNKRVPRIIENYNHEEPPTLHAFFNFSGEDSRSADKNLDATATDNMEANLAS